MKQITSLVLLVSCISSLAQSADYNTKKGYVAAGYDVISYFEKDPQVGKDAFVVTHDGVKFRFSSLENKNRFLKNPGQYVPQYGGYCAYAMAVTAKKVSINPETFEIRDSKLYLFYNSGKNNTLEKWLDESPDSLREKADENWNKIRVMRK